jgi:hypothetical protein
MLVTMLKKFSDEEFLKIQGRSSILTILSLFTSFGTLICCALPALFVALGMGAVLAGLVSSVPQIVWLSEHKFWLFSVAAILLLVAGCSIFFARKLPCPVDPHLRQVCLKGRKLTAIVFGIAAVCYMIGFFFAFIAK